VEDVAGSIYEALGEGLNKFMSLKGGLAKSLPASALERVLLVSARSAASTCSRSMTDRYMANDTPWLDTAGAYTRLLLNSS